MITNATPLSVVKITLLLSILNSFKALDSSLIMLDDALGAFCDFLKAFLTSTLSSLGCPCSNFGHGMQWVHRRDS